MSFKEYEEKRQALAKQAQIRYIPPQGKPSSLFPLLSGIILGVFFSAFFTVIA